MSISSASGDIVTAIYPSREDSTTTSLPSATAMARSEHTALEVTLRPVEGSRSTRRLRREGLVPGVVYGGGAEPVAFSVNARILRSALAHAGSVLDLAVDGGTATPVIVKDVQNHPVRGEAIHVDLLRVDMTQPIHSTAVLDLVGAEDSPGVSEGGVLSQETREVNILALPDDLPDVIQHDVSKMEMNETLTLAAVTVPQGVTLLDDLDETVIATITPPTLEPVEEDIETETALVGEDGEPLEGAELEEAERQAEGDTADEAAEASGDDS
jgi:large subunit ribosomal protein L25